MTAYLFVGFLPYLTPSSLTSFENFQWLPGACPSRKAFGPKMLPRESWLVRRSTGLIFPGQRCLATSLASWSSIFARPLPRRSPGWSFQNASSQGNLISVLSVKLGLPVLSLSVRKATPTTRTPFTTLLAQWLHECRRGTNTETRVLSQCSCFLMLWKSKFTSRRLSKR